MRKTPRLIALATMAAFAATTAFSVPALAKPKPKNVPSEPQAAFDAFLFIDPVENTKSAPPGGPDAPPALQSPRDPASGVATQRSVQGTHVPTGAEPQSYSFGASQAGTGGYIGSRTANGSDGGDVCERGRTCQAKSATPPIQRPAARGRRKPRN